MAFIHPTRTIGPLHLEDLEPHRFEDLVRQLLYDFKEWLRVEGTGRTGADDGFDVRGVQTASVDANQAEEDDVDQDGPPSSEERIWLIQCKREKSIAAQKISNYMDGLRASLQEGVYGVIFVAACDFTKATRDAFYAKAREFGVSEAHLWGKAEIEDMLFQPRNDHLLFAYTGISLVSRRRTMKSEVRSRLANKRKAKRILVEGQNVLIRDASDDRYPYLDPDRTKDRLERGRWQIFLFKGWFSGGLLFQVKRHFAWLSADGVAWDCDETIDEAAPPHQEDPWKPDDFQQQQSQRKKVESFWRALPMGEKGWYSRTAVLPYESILDIDESGDEWVARPHIYTTKFAQQQGLFSYFTDELVTTNPYNPRSIRADPLRIFQVEISHECNPSKPRPIEANPEARVKKFPK